MKVSSLVFPTSIIERVKCNWLSHENRHDIEEGLTDNELVLDFVRLSNRHDAETGLADEIATIVMDQTSASKLGGWSLERFSVIADRV